MKTKPSFARTFTLSQLSASTATAVDFALLFFMTEVLGIWYVVSVATGASAGAITNFLLNRFWTFQVGHLHWRGQALRYSVVSLGSLLLNTAGTWAVTEWLGVPYGASVIVVSLAVGVGFNYPLQHFFVFRSEPAAKTAATLDLTEETSAKSEAAKASHAP